MALIGDVREREYQKFRDTPTGAAIAVTGSTESGSFTVETAGVEWDEIITTTPATNVEVFTYKLVNVTVQTVTVTYESPQKKIPLSIVKVKT